MDPSPSVAVVILNWNGKKYLQQFLPYVLATDYPNWQLVIADNASTDDSVSFLRQLYREVRVIQLPQNFGFAQGYNEALRQVEADYFLLLNSDVEVTPGWLHPMVNLLEKDPSHAACQPKIRSYQRKDFFEYAGAAGGWLDLYGYPFSRGRVFEVCEEDGGQYNTAEEVFWATGAALLIKSRVYHEMGGLDAFFFAHQEEIDLCWRAKRAGYKIFCEPASVVYHVGGGTLPRGNSKKTFLNFRNNLVMLAKNLPLREAWWKIPYRIGLDDISSLKGLLSGDGGYFIAIQKAHFAFVRWLLRDRKKSTMFKGSKPGLSQLTGVYRGNVVWQYFVKGKKKFRDIIH